MNKQDAAPACTIVSVDFTLVSNLQGNDSVNLGRVLTELRDDLGPQETGEMLVIDAAVDEEPLFEWFENRETDSGFALIVVLCVGNQQIQRCRQRLMRTSETVMCVSRDQWLQDSQADISDRGETDDYKQQKPAPRADKVVELTDKGRAPSVNPQIVSVFSPKGGVGRTTTAVNLAVRAQAALGLDTVLIDLDIGGGDVALHLDLFDTPTVVDLLAYGEDINPQVVQDVAVEFRPSGLSVIPAPGKAELVEVATWEKLCKVVQMCSEMFDLVVLDTPGYSACQLSYRAAGASTYILAPITPDIISPRRMKSAMNVLKELSPKLPDKVHLLMNRYYEGALVTPREIEEFLESPCVGCFPEFPGATAAEAAGAGQPLILKKDDRNFEKALDSVLEDIFRISVPDRKSPWWRRVIDRISLVGAKGMMSR